MKKDVFFWGEGRKETRFFALDKEGEGEVGAPNVILTLLARQLYNRVIASSD